MKILTALFFLGLAHIFFSGCVSNERRANPENGDGRHVEYPGLVGTNVEWPRLEEETESD